MSPSTTSSDDPYIIDRMGCSSVLVCVAEEEWFRERGSMHNEEVLEKSGWKGEEELM